MGRQGSSYLGGSTIWPSGPKEKAPKHIWRKKDRRERDSAIVERIRATSALAEFDKEQIDDLLRDNQLLQRIGFSGPDRRRIVSYARRSFKALALSGAISDAEIARIWNEVKFVNGIGRKWTPIHVALLRRLLDRELKLFSIQLNKKRRS